MIKEIIRRRMQQRAGADTDGTEQPKEDGFTLIELMVVLLIVAILAAVAIPTFLGARTRAQHSAAVQDMINAVTAAQTVYSTNNSSYAPPTTGACASAATPTFVCALQAAEPSLQFIAGATKLGDSNSISVGVGGATNGSGAPQSIMMAVYDQANRCDVVLEIANPTSSAVGMAGATTSGGSASSAGTWYGTEPATAGTCDVVSTGNTYATQTLSTGWSQTPPTS